MICQRCYQTIEVVEGKDQCLCTQVHGYARPIYPDLKTTSRQKYRNQNRKEWSRK